MMSGKRHAFGVLLARFLFAAAITALLLYAMRGIFLNVETGVKVDFELRYGNRADNHWQIFYKTEDGPNWERLPSERMDAEAESTKIRALLPVKTLREIRLDFGSAPGDVVCRGFSVEGSERIAFGDMTKTRDKQLENLELRPDGLTCSSSGKDPYIAFKLDRELRRGTFYDVDVWSLLIPLVSIFLVALALSRVFDAGGRKKDLVFWADGALLLLFAVALFVPMSGFDDEEIAPAENRRLAKYHPLITEDGTINYRYGREFDAWFNDHFRGREELLKLNSCWFSLTARLQLQDCGLAYRGFDDWFFLAANGALRNYHNIDLLDEKTLAQAAADLNRIRDVCRRNNKRFYVLIVPDKHKVYGEFFPAAPKIRPDDRSRVDQFVRYMEKHAPEVPVMYLRDALLKNKSRGPLYWKNDSHWNEMGAYIGYLELMGRIRNDLPDIPICAVREVKMERDDAPNALGNDLVKFSHGLAKPDSTRYPVPRFDKKYVLKGDGLDRSFGTSLILNPSGKYKALVLRDSFGISLLPYMGNSFESITALWSRYLLPKDKLNVFRESDVLIVECVEQFLPLMLSRIHVTAANLESGAK